jgi:hypothetical protein
MYKKLSGNCTVLTKYMIFAKKLQKQCHFIGMCGVLYNRSAKMSAAEKELQNRREYHEITQENYSDNSGGGNSCNGIGDPRFGDKPFGSDSKAGGILFIQPDSQDNSRKIYHPYEREPQLHTL